jgi:phospholipid/cholesterol/gamma-HCH transport system substrate-binding protein
LSPALEQLAAAGSDLPHALRVAGTFPFPLGTTLQAVRGDYANLHLFLDLTLTNELCGINKALCLTSGAGGGLLNGLTSGTSAGTSKSTKPSSAVENPLLVGLGG